MGFDGNNGFPSLKDLTVIGRDSGQELVNIGPDQTVALGVEDEAVQAEIAAGNNELSLSVIISASDIEDMGPEMADPYAFLVPNTSCASCHRLNGLRFDFHSLSGFEDRGHHRVTTSDQGCGPRHVLGRLRASSLIEAAAGRTPCYLPFSSKRLPGGEDTMRHLFFAGLIGCAPSDDAAELDAPRFDEVITGTEGDVDNGFTFVPEAEDGVSVERLDPGRYLGLWYEIATTPSQQQAFCSGTTAEYSLGDDATIGVTNRCRIGELDGSQNPHRGTVLARSTTPMRDCLVDLGFGWAPYAKSSTSSGWRKGNPTATPSSPGVVFSFGSSRVRRRISDGSVRFSSTPR